MTYPATSARADTYARITEEILDAIAAGAKAWRMPWHHEGADSSRPANVSGRRYRGVNVLALWAAAWRAGYGSGVWATYAQWRGVGAQVRRGERATTVVLWKPVPGPSEADPSEALRRPSRAFARAFAVFNLAQVDGLAGAPPEPASSGGGAARRFFEALGIATTEGPFDAHYRIAEDRIYMPPADAFEDDAAYLGTLAHECAHATGASHRLDRSFAARFGPEALAMEEITAELAAGFLLADLGLAHRPRPDHAAYIASWLKLLKNDPRAVFTAAAKAQAAADWMHAQQPQPAPPAPQPRSGQSASE